MKAAPRLEPTSRLGEAGAVWPAAVSVADTPPDVRPGEAAAEADAVGNSGAGFFSPML